MIFFFQKATSFLLIDFKSPVKNYYNPLHYLPVLLLGIATTLTPVSINLLEAYFCLLAALAIISGLIAPFIAACGLKIALS